MKQTLQTIWYMPWQKKLGWFVAASIVMAWIFQLFTPKLAEVQPTMLTNYGNVVTTVENIDFSGQTPVLPEKLPIAEVTEFSNNHNHIISTLTKTLSLSPVAAVDDVWNSSEFSLSYSEDPEMITLLRLSRDESPTRDAVTPVFTQATLSSITSTAQDLLKELYPNNPPVWIESGVYFTSGGDEPERVNSLQEAGFIYLPFAYKIGNFPIFSKQDSRYVAKFVFSANQQIIKAEFFPYTLSADVDRSYDSLTLRQAMSNLNSNQAALIYTDHYDPSNPDTTNFISGTMAEAQVEYRFDPASGTIYPYYHFSGSVNSPSIKNISAEFITPAIQTNFESDN